MSLQDQISAIMGGPTVPCGILVDPQQEVAEVLSSLRSSGFAFSGMPIFTPGLTDASIPSDQISALVAGVIEQTDDLESALVRADYLALPTVILDLERDLLAGRRLASHFAQSFATPVWLQVPWSSEEGWKTWHTVRTLCDYPRNLSLCLEVDEEPPAEALLDRWLHEPVSCVQFSAARFDASFRLHAVFADALHRLFRATTNKVLIAAPKGAAIAQLSQLRAGVVALWQEAWSGTSEREQFDAGLRGQLVPLVQPLQDNLRNDTYEHFERCPAKYKKYEEGITAALKRRGQRAVVAIAGAGRGPLVRLILSASSRLGIEPTVYAIEKNPGAAATLVLENERRWSNQVKVVQEDFREWAAPEPVDLLVSELLGGFGDNELSPECLDGAQRLLGENGEIIPSHYQSFVAPAFAPTVHMAIGSDREARERTYGIDLSRTQLLASPQPCFAFHHPNEEVVPDNTHNHRHRELTFTFSKPQVVHGLVGFFEADLAGVKLSTNPSSSHDSNSQLASWAPAYFPFHEPLLADQLTCHLWRRSANRFVWYEWSVVEPQVSPIHNLGGRSEKVAF